MCFLFQQPTIYCVWHHIDEKNNLYINTDKHHMNQPFIVCGTIFMKIKRNQKDEKKK